ncbi:MAG TPA: ATP-binding protein [bacterium]|nr:ATP-binding protein [bacterium]HOL46848.1 ATP-binding protein [bacterium]HPQ18803.1 ATP-binding protein [bacterium]
MLRKFYAYLKNKNIKNILFILSQIIVFILILLFYLLIFHFEIIKFSKNISFIIIIVISSILLINIYLFKVIEEKRNKEFIYNTKKKWENFTRMTSTLAHEIRNPLSSLMVNIDLIKEKVIKANFEENWLINKLEILKKEVTRLNNILENFLNIARGKKLNLQKININKILEEIVLLETSKLALINNKIKIRFDTSDNEIFIIGDEEQLKQALYNLIKNAEEAVDEKGEGEIIIKTSLKGKKVNIYIIDTGIGIPENNLKRVFDIYFTTKRDGSGIGLSVANRIIEQHNGIMKINSFVNKGTFINIELPVELKEQ